MNVNEKNLPKSSDNKDEEISIPTNLQFLGRLDIVPTILEKYPNELLKIDYGKGLNNIRGNLLSPAKVKNIPLLDWTTEKDTYYTIIMVDPDAPTSLRPVFAEYQHWVVVNIPGKWILRGDTMKEFIPPLPPRATGYHRIVFAVFKQPHWTRFMERRISRDSGKLRARFKTMNFAHKYKLELVAANAFVVEWDQMVPFIHKEIQQRSEKHSLKRDSSFH